MDVKLQQIPIQLLISVRVCSPSKAVFFRFCPLSTPPIGNGDHVVAWAPSDATYEPVSWFCVWKKAE